MHSDSNHSDSNYEGKGVLFVFQPNTLFKYRIEESTVISNTIGDPKYQTVNKFSNQIALSYEMLKEKGQKYNVVVRIDSAYANDGIENDFEDSVKISKRDSSHNVFNIIQGIKLKIKIDEHGRVVNMDGLDTLDEKKLNKELVSHHSKSDLIISSMSYIPFSENYFGDIFESITFVLPNNTVYVNSVWQKNNSENFGEVKNIKTKYICDKIVGGIAYINSSAEFKRSLSHLGKIVQVEGTQKGEIQIDEKSGTVIYSIGLIKMTSVTEIGGVRVSTLTEKRATVERR